MQDDRNIMMPRRMIDPAASTGMYNCGQIFRVSIAFRHVASFYTDTPWDLSWNLQPDDTSGAPTIKIVAQSVATCSNFRIGANLEPLRLLDMVECRPILSLVK